MKDYFKEFFTIPKSPLLTRDQFVSKYMPQYKNEYHPDYRIRTYTNKKGQLRCPKITKGSIQAQITKRNNRIDAEYGNYCMMWNAA